MANQTKAWVILIILSIVWGSSFILMEKAMHPTKLDVAFNAYQVGALRTFIAALVLLPVALRHINKITKYNFKFFIIVGACGNFIPAFLFPIAETGIQSSLAGMLNMGTSLFVVVFSILFVKAKITKNQFFGFLIGAVGLVLLLSSLIKLGENSLSHALIVIGATVFYAISLMTIKYKLSGEKPLVITALGFFSMLIPSVIACFATGSFYAVFYIPEVQDGLPYLLILSIVGTALAVLLFNYMVVFSSPLFASSVTYLIPVVAILIGVWDGEIFPIINVVWIFVIFVGLYLMSKNKSVKPPKENKKVINTALLKK